VTVPVNVDNFIRAESDRMFSDLQRDAGGVNRFCHNREPADIGKQTVIRMNRDTLYSFAVVNVRAGAVLGLPESSGRYMSAMIVNNDHLVTAIHHDAGEYQLEESSVGTPFALVGVRILVDPTSDVDIAEVRRLQDQITLTAVADQEFVGGDYESATLDTTRGALLTLASGLSNFDHMFGTRDQIEPVHHLIGTAAGWGGLPTTEAVYIGVQPAGSGDYSLTLKDVPAEAFWSVSVYNAAGYFEENQYQAYTVNSVTAQPNSDGSVTVIFLAGSPREPNSIVVPPRWNYLIRLYRPTKQFFDGSWRLPEAVALGSSDGL